MTMAIDLLSHELKGHWLAPVKRDRATIRAANRAAYYAGLKPKPARPETMARARAVYQGIKSRDPSVPKVESGIDLLSHELKGHWLAPANKIDRQAIRDKHRAIYLANIKPKPASDQTMARARSLYDDIRVRAGLPRLAPAAPAPLEPEPEVPVKVQLVAWSKAVMVLDASEVMIRDLIERELAGRTGQSTGPNAMIIARRLVERIAGVRQDAIKLAFRTVRDLIGDRPILGVSLDRWAQSISLKDAKSIDIAIQTGLIGGFDNTEIARRVVGSMSLDGVDGVTEFTRHWIAHLGRAAIKESTLRTQEAMP